MPELSVGQFGLVYNMFSFTIATMFAAFAFFVLSRQQVASKFRPALIVSALQRCLSLRGLAPDCAITFGGARCGLKSR